MAGIRCRAIPPVCRLAAKCSSVLLCYTSRPRLRGIRPPEAEGLFKVSAFSGPKPARDFQTTLGAGCGRPHGCGTIRPGSPVRSASSGGSGHGIGSSRSAASNAGTYRCRRRPRLRFVGARGKICRNNKRALSSRAANAGSRGGEAAGGEMITHDGPEALPPCSLGTHRPTHRPAERERGAPLTTDEA